MSLAKVILATDANGVSTEYWNKTLAEVMSEVGGQDVELKLQKYSHNGVGYQFISEARIGNAKDDLNRGDYYQAYDQIF